MTEDPMEPKQIMQDIEKEFFDFIVNGLADLPIYMLSPTGVIQTWSVGAKTLKQFDASDVLGKNFSMFYTKPDLEKNLPARELVQAAQTGTLTSCSLFAMTAMQETSDVRYHWLQPEQSSKR